MGFNFDVGFGDEDSYTTLGTAGYYNVDTNPIYPDNSYGAADMTTSTPTGGGSGVFMDTGWQNGLFGMLQQGLNYALLRDQQKMTAVAYNPVAQAQQAAQQSAIMQQSRNANLLVLLAVGGLVLLMVRR